VASPRSRLALATIANRRYFAAAVRLNVCFAAQYLAVTGRHR
jgi:hypothetical protein